MCLCSIDKWWKLISKKIDKHLIEESTRYTYKNFKQREGHKEWWMYICHSDDVVNGDFVVLSKIGNHTLEYCIEKDDYVVAI